MAQERLGNSGYFALIKQADPNVILTPTDYIPLYEESINTNGNFGEQAPIIGQKFNRYNVLQGQRGHNGDVTILAEPNTTARICDMLLTKGTTTGSNPYTHPFTLSILQNPNSYVVDISSGNVVARYWGVGASKMGSVWSDNELRLKVAISALGSFQGREISSVSTTTITLKTDYDPNPSKGLVTGDLVRIYKASTGATLDTTVATVNGDGVTVVLGASAAAFATGDFIYLRPATPSFNILPTFLWSKTQFCFGATAAAALAATHTPLEPGSDWEFMHDFEENEGSKRSGSFDPAALIRLTGDANFTAKQFFDTPEAIRRFNALEKQAVVIRHFSGPTNQYELRITLNHIKTSGNPMPDIKANSVNYSEITYMPQYDQTDGQGADIKVIDALSTV